MGKDWKKTYSLRSGTKWGLCPLIISFQHCTESSNQEVRHSAYTKRSKTFLFESNIELHTRKILDIINKYRKVSRHKINIKNQWYFDMLAMKSLEIKWEKHSIYNSIKKNKIFINKFSERQARFVWQIIKQVKRNQRKLKFKDISCL